ncbi:MAG: hypothetical protein B5766_05530 [Candidatus Lumbricidophila eiseniae]|uniref:Metallo-beta-lactamase domain-containing protein n=1 Tax=Candidatus Lumbricidiphila eiseniae TaxID=1969409 RepID=A0A2A6FSD4_9MICO|nr:MAG: hypothetical protein B5766_05530 [Candidatus Lumbricidophila eiseniae]
MPVLRSSLDTRRYSRTVSSLIRTHPPLNPTISGANCAVVTALVFAAASALRFRRSVRIIASLVALLGFIVLVTPESTVLRAGMMAVVVLIGLASGRRAGGVSALGVSVIVLLAVNPWYARDYGFALSVFATGGLLFLTAPLTRLGTRVLPRWCALTLAVPVAAQLACQPILILLTPSIPLYGVAANLLAAPAATLATVVGLMGCLVLPALPSVGYAFLQVAWLPASWIAVLARTVTSMPGAQLPWLPSVPGALLLAGLLGGGCWLLWGSSRWRRLRLVVGAAITVGTAVPLGITVGAPSITAATRPGEWAIALCDVGQGDAVFVRSGTSIALIDTGPEPSELERCRAELGIERVSLLVLTHWDLDHVGGVPAVGGRVDEVLHGPLDGMRSSRALDPLVSGGATLTEVRAGFSGTLGSIAWRVLWPIADIAPGNDASVVIDMEDVSYRAIFLGDLGAAAQQRMRSLGGVRPVNIVKVSHHGSSDQSPELYFELRAAVALIGVGAHNTYGHPTSRLLDLLARTETRVVRTDTMGLSLLTATPTRLRLWSERAPPVTTQPRPVGGSA